MREESVLRFAGGGQGQVLLLSFCEQGQLCRFLGSPPSFLLQ